MNAIALPSRVAALPSSACGPPAVGGLRVAVVTETYPPEVNGVALTLAQVVRGLQARGHHVHLIRPRQEADFGPGATAAQWHAAAEGLRPRPGPRPLHEKMVKGLPIPFYPHLRLGLPARRELVRAWTQARPDVVHVATEGPLGYSAVRAAQQLGIAVTSDFRTNFHAYTQHYGIGWLRRPILAYLRAFHNCTAVTMVPTEALRAQLEALGFRNLAVVSRGVDVRHFDPSMRSTEMRRSWGVSDDDPVIIHVGRLAAEKNLGLLVRAFERITQQHPSARLLLVGDGPQRDFMRAQVPSAIFAGQRHGSDLAAHYASADLFLFPSLTETFGNVTAEAMASGLAVVAYDYAAAAQLIRPGLSGVLVARGNEAQFVRAALSLAGSAAYRVALGAQARHEAHAHDWASVLVRFERLLWQTLGTRPPAVVHSMSGVNAACNTT